MSEASKRNIAELQLDYTSCNTALQSTNDRQYGDLAVIYRPPESLTPCKRNTRTHSKAQIRKIAESIRSFGFTNPVLITPAGLIITGHGRVKAAVLLRIETIPTICLENLTPDQIRAYALADNRIALEAGWDADLLKIELLYLDSLPNFDIALTGFEIPEIDLLIGVPEVAAGPVEQVPAITSTAITQPGDLWLLDKHKLLCGDARNPTVFASLMGGRKASVAFTDPPYSVPIDGHASGNGRHHHADFLMASGEMSPAEFTDFLTEALTQLARSSAAGAVHFVATDWRHLSELLEAGRRVYDSLLNVCVWSKDNAGMGSFYRSQHELFFVYKVGKTKHRNNVMLGKLGRYRTNVWKYPSASTLSRQGAEGNLLAMHPTVKPTSLVADALLDCSARGEIVLDCFLGSGSTLLAAERTRRVCYALELDPLYVDLAIRRWQDLTGEKAVHASSGISFAAQSDKETAHG